MDESWRQSMRLRLDFNNMMSDQLGKRGLYRRELEGMQKDIDTAIANMRAKRPLMKWRELPYNQEEVVKSILAAAETIRDSFENFVVLGIGGSALGPVAVQQALNHLHYNDLPKEKRGGPRLFVEDNIDPERMDALLDVIDVEKTAFNVVSKSGGTSETMSQLLIVASLLHEKLGGDIRSHLFATTDENKGHLLKIAKAENLTTFYIPEGVGGRFSELCPVGLLAAAVCGIDIGNCSRARRLWTDCATQRRMEEPRLHAATLQVAAMEPAATSAS